MPSPSILKLHIKPISRNIVCRLWLIVFWRIYSDNKFTSWDEFIRFQFFQKLSVCRMLVWVNYRMSCENGKAPTMVIFSIEDLVNKHLAHFVLNLRAFALYVNQEFSKPLFQTSLVWTLNLFTHIISYKQCFLYTISF